MKSEMADNATKQAKSKTIGSVIAMVKVFSSIEPLNVAYINNAAPYIASDFQ
jgi:hypothetical protein